MATVVGKVCRMVQATRLKCCIFSANPVRYSNTLSDLVVERHRKSRLNVDQEVEEKPPVQQAPRHYKHVYPEFLPEPNWQHRDRIREKLERKDMLRRRAVIDIPEFYVGSIMAMTVSDKYAPGKKNRFIGICIQRGGVGLRAHFTLRNIIDGQGVEIRYDMYNPVVLQVEVLKLEKRLDDELFYLRDAPQEYSTVPFDFEAVTLPPGAPVPVNTMKVQMGPRPWHERWERQELQGIEDLELPQVFYDRAAKVAKPWEKYDLMKQYRGSINDVDTDNIMSEIYGDLEEIEKQTKKKKLGSLLAKTKS